MVTIWISSKNTLIDFIFISIALDIINNYRIGFIEFYLFLLRQTIEICPFNSTINRIELAKLIAENFSRSLIKKIITNGSPNRSIVKKSSSFKRIEVISPFKIIKTMISYFIIIKISFLLQNI